MNKILIVEDEEAIANLIRINLQHAGYSVRLGSTPPHRKATCSLQSSPDCPSSRETSYGSVQNPDLKLPGQEDAREDVPKRPPAR